MRRASRVDDNQQAIVAALRAAGATVEIIGKPVDLLVGHRGRNLLIEVKNPKTAYGRGKADNRSRTLKTQADFRATWRGLVWVVSSPEQALALIGVRTANRTTPFGGFRLCPCGRALSADEFDLCEGCTYATTDAAQSMTPEGE